MWKLSGMWSNRRSHDPLRPDDRLRPARDVLSTEHEGSTVLLDLRRQVYLGLDEVGTAIWRGIEQGSTCAEIEGSLQAEYDADPAVLRRDTQLFLDDLLSRGLAVPSSAGASHRAGPAKATGRSRNSNPRVPGVLVCFFTILVMDLLPRVLGFRRAFQVTGVLSPPESPGLDRALVDATAHRVALAAAFYPRRALCLEQSLALCLLLQRRSVAARFRLGVQARPFYAHAWVDIDGRAVNERTELTLRMATFPGFGG
jgi:hypothetical protein